LITLDQIEKIIEELDYNIKKLATVQSKRPGITNIIAITAILISIYMLASRMGILNIFNNFPVAKEGTGYAMLFIIGLLTSVHCVAMCGGICLSQCTPRTSEGEKPSRFSALRPSFLYNTGRVISYTIIGGIVGAIGSVVSFSGPMKGLVQIIAGIFMVIMGLNMLNVFPWLRRFNPRMPKIFARKIHAGKKDKGPLYIGLLNGLMPCGPLQAMQLYALSTGNPLEGALSMFLFSIGTVPLMFIFGAIGSLLNKKFTGKMMSISAVLVVVLGVFMFSNGTSLAGIAFPTITGNAQSSNKNLNVAVITEGVQAVTSKVNSGSYESITVQKGIPVQWTLTAAEGSLNGCNNSITVPEYSINYDLKTGDNVIEFTPNDSGTYSFSCWMGMIRSKIYVVDDLNDFELADNTSNSGEDALPNCCSPGYVNNGADNSDSDTNSGANDGTDKGSTEDNNNTADNNTDNGFNNLLIPQIPTDMLAIAKVTEDIQEVGITFDEKGFSPAVVVMQKGFETNWNINYEPSEGSKNVIFPLYYAQISVKDGENIITLIPEQDFYFYTEDNSFYGYVKVVDDINAIDIEAIKNEVAAFVPEAQSYDDSYGLPSCH
jgi:sulfite exporter TauE/SafE